jgi:hypothetical protein
MKSIEYYNFFKNKLSIILKIINIEKTGNNMIPSCLKNYFYMSIHIKLFLFILFLENYAQLFILNFLRSIYLY